MEPSSTPPVARRRKVFPIFNKRTVSEETIQGREPNKVTSKAGNGDRNGFQQSSGRLQNRMDSALSTPRASTSSFTTNMSPKSVEKKMVPEPLHLANSALITENNRSIDSAEVSNDTHATNDSNDTPKRLPVRQNSSGMNGLQGKRFPGRHTSRPSWGSDRRRFSRDGQEQNFTSTDYGSDALRRASLAGAKPVAPSYHPDAPSELKVKSPSSAVLLPFLSIPANRHAPQDDHQDLAGKVDSPLSPPDFQAEKVLGSSSIKHQRPGIKIRIITWNQGSSVPKGDLEVLLGRVGEFIAPQEGWDESSDEESDVDAPKLKHRGMGVAGQEKTPRKDRIPPLPHDDAHPYHIVIVAGQECPWGDGKRIATGVGLAGELGDLSRSKSRAAAAKKEKDAIKKIEEQKNFEEKMLASAMDGEFPFTDSTGNGSVPSTPFPPPSVPTTPGPAGLGGQWGIGGKGWSDMCEDWLCRGPLAQATATKGLAQASKAIASSPMILSPADTPENAATPAHSRATTPLPDKRQHPGPSSVSTLPTQVSATDSTMNSGKEEKKIVARDYHYSAVNDKKGGLSIPTTKNVNRSISFANKSRDKLELPSSSSAQNEEESISSSPVNRPISPIKQAIDIHARIPAQQTRQQTLAGKPHHRLGLHIPGLSASHHVTVQSDGTPLSLGAYELVAKERCYMMYMAVYVWRGCLDRVTKTSQGHVKSGLLAGRVGNKGAVGISLKLGLTRLLFVNAHLAAHEGKVAERIANVEKIKSELKLDTFLPPEDPRNKTNDVTEAFDYAFWFGDLNFRVDISRRHADWLLMKKQYQDALAFDQLKKVMKEQPNVFKNFHEADITFPPTFKYDVLKTIRQKREEKEKKKMSNASKSQQQDGNDLRWNEGLSISTSQRDLNLKNSSSLTNMSVVKTTTPTRPRQSGQLHDHSSSLLVREKREEEGSDNDTSSISSSNWASSAVSTSAGHPSDRDEFGTSPSSGQGDDSQFTALDSIVSSNTAAVEGHALHGKAIKAKKRFMEVVHAIGHRSSHHREKEGHVPHILKAGLKQRERNQSEANLNDTTMASASKIEIPPPPTPPPKSHLIHLRKESSNSLSDLTKSPNSNQIGDLTRRRSSLGEVSTTSPYRKQQQRKDEEEEEEDYDHIQPSSSLIAMMNEYEKQPYDTSAKQRVPSWCDRVLWKSNVEVIFNEEGGPRWSINIDGNASLQNRMSTAFSNAFSNDKLRLGHFRPEKRQSVSFAKDDMGRRSRSFALPSSTSLENGSPSVSNGSTNRALSPRRRWFLRKDGDNLIKRSATFDHRRTGSMSSKIPETITDDSNYRKRTMSAIDLSIRGQRSSSSQSVPTVTAKKRDMNMTTSPTIETTSPRSSTPQLEDDDLGTARPFRAGMSNEQHVAFPSTEFGQKEQYHRRQSPNVKSAPLRDARTTDSNNQASKNGSNRKSTWWNDFKEGHLSSLLTPLGAINAFTSNRHDINQGIGNDTRRYDQNRDIEEEELIGPHKGQIQCLLYKSLDDREMRLLEGRSDHRPVIWVGSIGV